MHFILFADDTNLFYSHSDINALILNVNAEISKIATWCNVNKLSLNIKKTNFIIFCRKCIPDHVNITICINNVNLERVKYVKFLGVLIDEKLNWKEHVNYIKTKVSKGIGIICRVRNVLPHRILLMLYNTLIHPYLSYCNIIWGAAKISTLNSLFLLQKKGC